MVQRAQIIDITKSYLPGHPNSFPQNLVNTDREDGEEKTMPIIPFEGYNFLPTSYGYRSYFGIENSLSVGTLGSRAQFILSYQLPNYKSMLIALCEDGIWLCDGTVLNAPWTQAIILTYDPDILLEWSWCIIENVFYCYQAGRPNAWKSSVALNVLSMATHTPNFLNMTGQMGIFKAGLRLGFWDSANSVSWSSNFDLLDFVPAIETFAGNTIYGDTIGRIVTIRSHGQGYVIYATKAVVGVNYSEGGNLLWDGKKIFDAVGVYHSRSVTFGQSDNEHMAYTSAGIFMIGKFNSLSGKHEVELISPATYDYLKEPRDPVYLDTINSRYVFFAIMSNEYVYGKSIFTYEDPEDYNVQFMIGEAPWAGTGLPNVSWNCVQAANIIKQLVTFGFVRDENRSALWTAQTVSTQDDGNDPFQEGFARDAQNLGFTTQNIVDNYITGSTLPAELDPNAIEHPEAFTGAIGTGVPGIVTIVGAHSSSVEEILYNQKVVWELFIQHQAKAFAAVELATKVVTTVGVTAYYSDTDVPLPALPANTTVDTVIGTYRTGDGNTEIQRDEPLNTLYLRKYFQQGRTITKRKITSYVWRAAGTAASIRKTAIPAFTARLPYYSGADTTMTPSTYPVPAIALASTGTLADHIAYVKSQLMAASPATIFRTSDGQVSTKDFAGVVGSTTTAGGNISLFVQYTSPTGFGREYGNEPFSIFAPLVTMNLYYQDVVETYSYIISALITTDLGSEDLQLLQTDLVDVLIQVTSDPPTIVVHSPVPIFPTGPSAITFFPPTWNGVETLKVIAGSAYSPWHLIDGTFGIELVGDPLAGALNYPEGEVCAVDTIGNYAGTEFGLTYSQFPYILQQGTPAPLYPAFAGALVLDLALKKWGKMKAPYYTLTDLNAINLATPEVITADDYGMTACLRYIDNTLRVFNELPVDSILRYGRVGSYRLGMTDILETKLYFRRAATGVLSIDSSMDGRTIDTTLQYTIPFTAVNIIEGLPDISARWHVVSISGNYDLTGLEIRAIVASRR